MTCEEARQLINADIDGELDLARSVELADHLRRCADCARSHAAMSAIHTGLSQSASYYEAPLKIQQRVRALARVSESSHSERDIRLPRLGWILIAAAAAIALFMVLIKDLVPWRGDPQMIAREVVADHVRSLMAAHLTDVLSSDQHTVKPWFEGKLTYSPVVRDLKQQGFPLIGGRLDYLNGKPVAAIVYKRRAHVINLFVQSQPGATTPLSTSTQDGYNVAHWVMGGESFWAVSSLNLDELQQFANLLINPTAAPS